MKTSSTKLLCLFISVTFILSCKKDGLTKATQEGANTFSCKLNGQAFQPCKDQSLFVGGSNLYGGVSVATVAVATVTAECNKVYPQKHISISLDNFHGTGEYLLTESENRGIYTEYLLVLPLVKTYESLYTTKGRVIITKDDRTNYILSGTFEFTAANTDSTNDIVTVTDGRFDINYKR